MSYVLDEQSADSYQYLECPGSTRITIQISNAPVYIGFGTDNPAGKTQGGTYDVDEPFLPIVGGLNRTCDEIRIKSYTPGNPAQVFITAQ